MLRQKGNDFQCRHLATHQVAEYPVTHVKIFHGTLEEAKRSAEEDYDNCKSSVEDHLATEHDTGARCVLGEYSAQKGLRQISIVGIVSKGSKTNVNSLL